MHTHRLLYGLCLQPENILLDDQLNVKLSDFGFATVVNHDHELTGERLVPCHMTTFTRVQSPSDLPPRKHFSNLVVMVTANF